MRRGSLQRLSILLAGATLASACFFPTLGDARARARATWPSGEINENAPVRAEHIKEVRDNIKNLRATCHLSAKTFEDPTLTSGITPIRAIHVNELRSAISGADFYPYITNFTDVPIVASETPIKAVHINELRSAYDEADCCGDGVCQEAYETSIGDLEDGKRECADCGTGIRECEWVNIGCSVNCPTSAPAPGFHCEKQQLPASHSRGARCRNPDYRAVADASCFPPVCTLGGEEEPSLSVHNIDLNCVETPPLVNTPWTVVDRPISGYFNYCLTSGGRPACTQVCLQRFSANNSNPNQPVCDCVGQANYSFNTSTQTAQIEATKCCPIGETIINIPNGVEARRALIDRLKACCASRLMVGSLVNFPALDASPAGQVFTYKCTPGYYCFVPPDGNSSIETPRPQPDKTKICTDTDINTDKDQRAFGPKRHEWELVSACSTSPMIKCQYLCDESKHYFLENGECVLRACGDGVIQSPEECDFGNNNTDTTPLSGCSKQCKFTNVEQTCAGTLPASTVWNNGPPASDKIAPKCTAGTNNNMNGSCTAPALPATEYNAALSQLSCNYKCDPSSRRVGSVCVPFSCPTVLSSSGQVLCPNATNGLTSAPTSNTLVDHPCPDNLAGTETCRTVCNGETGHHRETSTCRRSMSLPCPSLPLDLTNAVIVNQQTTLHICSKYTPLPLPGQCTSPVPPTIEWKLHKSFPSNKCTYKYVCLGAAPTGTTVCDVTKEPLNGTTPYAQVLTCSASSPACSYSVDSCTIKTANCTGTKPANAVEWSSGSKFTQECTKDVSQACTMGCTPTSKDWAYSALEMAQECTFKCDTASGYMWDGVSKCVKCLTDVGCNDTNACTTDTCVNGDCSNASVTCSASDKCHVIAACVPATGCPAETEKCPGQSCDLTTGACSPYECKLPAGRVTPMMYGRMCSGDDAGLTENVTISTVSGGLYCEWGVNTSKKCEYSCNATRGFNANAAGTDCVCRPNYSIQRPDDTVRALCYCDLTRNYLNEFNECLPQHSCWGSVGPGGIEAIEVCPNPAPRDGADQYHYADDCATSYFACGYQCKTGWHYNNQYCEPDVLAACSPTSIAYAQMCANDNQGLSAMTTSKTVVNSTGCTTQTKCEFECEVNRVPNGNNTACICNVATGYKYEVGGVCVKCTSATQATDCNDSDACTTDRCVSGACSNATLTCLADNCHNVMTCNPATGCPTPTEKCPGRSCDINTGICSGFVCLEPRPNNVILCPNRLAPVNSTTPYIEASEASCWSLPSSPACSYVKTACPVGQGWTGRGTDGQCVTVEITSCKPSPTSTTVGNNVVWTANARIIGGAGGYTAAYTWSGSLSTTAQAVVSYSLANTYISSVTSTANGVTSASFTCDPVVVTDPPDDSCDNMNGWHKNVDDVCTQDAIVNCPALPDPTANDYNTMQRYPVTCTEWDSTKPAGEQCRVWEEPRLVLLYSTESSEVLCRYKCKSEPEHVLKDGICIPKDKEYKCDLSSITHTTGQCTNEDMPVIATDNTIPTAVQDCTASTTCEWRCNVPMHFVPNALKTDCVCNAAEHFVLENDVCVCDALNRYKLFNGVCYQCGNGVKDPGEQCDFGNNNLVINSGCSSECTWAVRSQVCIPGLPDTIKYEWNNGTSDGTYTNTCTVGNHSIWGWCTTPLLPNTQYGAWVNPSCNYTCKTGYQWDNPSATCVINSCPSGYTRAPNSVCTKVTASCLNATATVGVPVTLTATATTDPTYPITYAWSGTNPTISGTTASITPTYPSPGTYTANITATANNVIGVGACTVTVNCPTDYHWNDLICIKCGVTQTWDEPTKTCKENVCPTDYRRGTDNVCTKLTVDCVNTTATAGSSVTLTATASTDPSYPIASYAWSGDDVLTYSGPLASTSHTYAKPGMYIATVSVNANGLSANDSCTVTVNCPQGYTTGTDDKCTLIGGFCTGDSNGMSITWTVTSAITTIPSTTYTPSYSWSGTDSLSDTRASFTKIYSIEGTKNATVVITANGVNKSVNCSAPVNNIICSNNPSCGTQPTGSTAWGTTTFTQSCTKDAAAADACTINCNPLTKSWIYSATNTGECQYHYVCSGIKPVQATLCTTTEPLSATAYSEVPTCGTTPCTYSLTCSNAPTCGGTKPAGTTAWAGTTYAQTCKKNAASQCVDACTPVSKNWGYQSTTGECKYHCDIANGYTLVNGNCVKTNISTVCPNKPTGSYTWIDAFNQTCSVATSETQCSTYTPASAPAWTYSATASMVECSYKCLTDYTVNAQDQCIAQCKGTNPPAANSALCTGDDTGLTTPIDRNLVASCSAPADVTKKCEFTCKTNFVKTGSTCTCNGIILPEGSTCTPVAPPSCGDGIVNGTPIEECDLGADNGVVGKGCSATCKFVCSGTKPVQATMCTGTNPPNPINTTTAYNEVTTCGTAVCSYSLACQNEPNCGGLFVTGTKRWGTKDTYTQNCKKNTLSQCVDACSPLSKNWGYSSTDTSTECTYHCDTANGYTRLNDACVNTRQTQCAGPLNTGWAYWNPIVAGTPTTTNDTYKQTCTVATNETTCSTYTPTSTPYFYSSTNQSLTKECNYHCDSNKNYYWTGSTCLQCLTTQHSTGEDCVDNVCGTQPANTTACNSLKPVTDNKVWQLNSGCVNSEACQYDINACTGTSPTNAQTCTSISVLPSSLIAKQLVQSCTSTSVQYCEYKCSETGYVYTSGSCIKPSQTLPCDSGTLPTGGIVQTSTYGRICATSNGTACLTWTPSSVPAWQNAPVGDCSFICDSANYTTTGTGISATCTPKCTGTTPANSIACTSSSTTPVSPTSKASVSTCSSDSATVQKCEYTCDGANKYYLKAGNCAGPCIGLLSGGTCADDTSPPDGPCGNECDNMDQNSCSINGCRCEGPRECDLTCPSLPEGRKCETLFICSCSGDGTNTETDITPATPVEGNDCTNQASRTVEICLETSWGPALMDSNGKTCENGCCPASGGTPKTCVPITSTMPMDTPSYYDFPINDSCPKNPGWPTTYRCTCGPNLLTTEPAEGTPNVCFTTTYNFSYNKSKCWDGQE